MSMYGKKTGEVAEALGISSQALSNKLYRNSFTADDLIKISEYFGCKLTFVDGIHNITLDLSDLREKGEGKTDSD